MENQGANEGYSPDQSEPSAAAPPAPPPMTTELSQDQLSGLSPTASKFVKDGNLNVTNLLRSYGEAEKKLSAQQANQDTKSDDFAIPRGGEGGGAESWNMDQTLSAAGLSVEMLVEQASSPEGIPQETFDALGRVGVPRAMAEFGIRGVVAEKKLAQQEVGAAINDAYETVQAGRAEVDGRAAFESLKTWAGTSGAYTEAELNVLETQLRDPATTKMATEHMMSRHQSAIGSGRAGPLVQAGSGPAGGAGMLITAQNYKEVLAQSRGSGPQAQIAKQALLQARANGTLASAIL